MTLDAWLKQNAITETDFGRRIGRTQTSVNRYRRDLRMPSRDVLRAITQATEGAVTPNDFAGMEAAA